MSEINFGAHIHPAKAQKHSKIEREIVYNNFLRHRKYNDQYLMEGTVYGWQRKSIMSKLSGKHGQIEGEKHRMSLNLR